MPTVDYSNQHAFFDELDFNLGFASFAATTPTTYSWLTSEGNTVTFVGTGINVDANNVPTSGIITSIEVTLSDSTGLAPDMVVTDITPVDLSVTDLTQLVSEEVLQLMLEGDTIIVGPSSTAGGIYTGDYYAVGYFSMTADTYFGGDLTVTGAFLDSSYVVGSAHYLETNTLWNSGTLNFNGSAYFVSGDAFQIRSRVIGGNDTIVLQDASASELGNIHVFYNGDTKEVAGSYASLTGGDDLIDARAMSDASIERIYIRGDAEKSLGLASFYGGNDTLYGSESLSNYIVGDADEVLPTSDFKGGNDTIYGGEGDDYLAGDFRHDLYDIYEGGDDVIYAGGGNDDIYGGAGEDNIILIDGSSYTRGDDGNDTISSTGGSHEIYGGKGNDTFTLSDGDDIVFGDADDDTFIIAGSGQYILNASTGTDTLVFNTGSGGVTFDLGSGRGGRGTEAVIISSYIENIRTNATGKDTITATSGENVIHTFGGDDKVLSAGLADTIYLGTGNDSMYANSYGENRFYGGKGIDLISYGDTRSGIIADLDSGNVKLGNSYVDQIASFEHLHGTKFYNDILRGSAGNNLIKGLGGNDTILGRYGNDTLDGGNGADVLYGGNGKDKLLGGTGSDRLKGDGGNDTMFGGGQTDKLFGGSGADSLSGGDGDDSLYGGNGEDALRGNSGSDYLDGQLGTDMLWGGGGADVFHFVKGSGKDFVKDFQNNIDTIQFKGFNPNVDPFDRATQSGDDVVFDFGSNGKLIVENTTITALQNDVEWIA